MVAGGLDPTVAGTAPNPAGASAQNQTGSSDPLIDDRRIAFVDSSALVALADSGDMSHAAAVAAYRELVDSDYRLFTTDFMIAEAFDLLRQGPGPEVARSWLSACAIAICPMEEQDLARAKQRLLNAPELPAIGFADAISLAVLDRLGVTDVFAVDQTVLNVMT